jgi:hypothetical protein
MAVQPKEMTMRFTMTHDFDCDPQTLWDIFESPEFDKRLERESQVRREVLNKSTEGDLEVTHLLCTSLKEMPAPMAKALGTKSFVFEQVGKLNRKANVLRWEVIPSVLKDRISASGTTRITPRDSGCTRTIEGEISIRLPIVGKAMEEKLAGNVQESYARAAEIARTMIAERS